MGRLKRAEFVAPILDVTTERVYEMSRNGTLPVGVVVRLGRQVRIDEDRLREWIAAGGNALPGGWRRQEA